MSNGKDIKVGITFSGDGSGLRGEIKTSAADFDKLTGSASGAGEAAKQSFRKMSLAQADYAKKTAAFKALDIRSTQDINREIKLVQASYKRLAVSGTTSASDLARASQAARNRVAELSHEIKSAGQATSSLGGSVARLVSVGVVFYGIKQGINTAEAAVIRSQSAILGLASIAKHTGADIEGSLVASLKLSSDGMMTNAESAKALQNLLSRGFSLQESTELINRFRDSAAFGRQASLTFGEAIVSATEGIKHENSILVDNAGVTKNVSVMWKEYAAQIGISVHDLTIAQKRQAEYNGIIRETAVQLGNAEKASNGLQGAQARANKATEDAASAFGKALTPALTAYYDISTKTIGAVGSMSNFLPELAFGAAAITTRFVAGRAAALGYAGALDVAKASAAGLLRTLVPSASALVVFEAGKIGLEAYAAGQNAAAASARSHATSMKMFNEVLRPAKAELASLGLSMDEFAGKMTADEFDAKVLKFLAALKKLRRAKVTPESANDKPASQESPEVKPLDPALAKKSLDDARALTNDLTTAFDDAFTKTSNKYSETWQKLVDTHGEGSAEVQALESAYQSWLDTTWDNQLMVAKSASDKVVGLQAAKYARINQAAAENAATDEGRALMRLDADLRAMEDERQRLIDQHNWTNTLEQFYADARISRAQATADQLGVIADEESARALEGLEGLVAAETAAYSFKGQLSQAFSKNQKVDQKAMLGNIQAFSKASVDWEKWSGQQKLGFSAATFGALSGLMSSENRKLFGAGKFAAHSENVIHTALGATKAISTLGPIAGPVAATAITLAGMANTQVIDAQQFNGGSGAVSVPTISAGGGSGEAQATVAVNPGTGLPIREQAPQPLVQYFDFSNSVVPQQLLDQYGPDWMANGGMDAFKRAVINNDAIPFPPDSAQAQVLRAA